jgi:6-methylsalicylic acid synthase
MSESNNAGLAEATARGLGTLSPTEALQAWQFTDRLSGDYFAIAPILSTTAATPILSDLQPADHLEHTAQASALDDIATDPATLAEDLRIQVAAELRLDPADVDPRRPLSEMGMDSVMTVALRARLLRRYGADLPPTIMWNQPTVHALAEQVTEQLIVRSEASCRTLAAVS